MNTQNPASSTSDLETLSALFDGQMQGDEARFALRRLGHDAQWRTAVGRWQLYGDVLRGQGAVVAEFGFAERVRLAVAQEPAVEAAPVTAAAGAARPAQRPRWINGAMGGALAASVALVALFVARPFDSETPGASSDASPVAVAQSPAANTPAVNQVAVQQTPAVPSPSVPSPDHQAGIAAAAVAVAEVPRRVADRRSSTRSQSQRAAPRSNARNESIQTAVAQADTTSPQQTVNPFKPDHDAIASRPWPRAVLPQYQSSGEVTASFQTGSTDSPSFYPFDPGAHGRESSSHEAAVAQPPQ